MRFDERNIQFHDSVNVCRVDCTRAMRWIRIEKEYEKYFQWGASKLRLVTMAPSNLPMANQF